MKKILLVLVLFTALSQSVKASHLMGGEITWECLSNGKYVFTMKIYRDCNGTTLGTAAQTLDVSNGAPITAITMNYVASRDISPQCYNSALQKSCGPKQSNGSYGTVTFPNNNGAVEEMIFRSSQITLAGVPGTNGWVFSWSLCCRNSAITNLANPGSVGFCLRAKMFRYNNPNGSGKNTNPCFDSSPQFSERPSTIIGTEYPFTYNHNAYDKELDSLTYAWDKPLDEFTGGTFSATNPPPCSFSGTYTFNSPLPGPAQDIRNIPATIDPNTGEISYTSYTQGNFVTVVKVTAYKCGQKVAEIYRELQVVLLSVGANNPPIITAPFPSNTYNLTVLAGDTVEFDLFASDPDLLPTGNPQTVYINASSGQFDTLTFDTASTLCNKPPCAGLFPPPPISSIGTAQTKFVWATNCNHISYLSGCATYSNTYSFLLTYRDNFCPTPALKVKTITIKVLAKVIIKAPSLRCSKVASNGDVKLSWVAPLDTDNTFSAYIIYASANKNGPFTAIDSLETIDGKKLDSTSYWHIGANANNIPMYYYIKSRSGCFGRLYSTNSDTIRTMRLTATNIGNNQASLVWNAPRKPLLPSVVGNYKIYRKVNNIWSLIKTTSDTSYIDTIAVCDEFVDYKIELEDLACTSVSSIGRDQFSDTVVPDAPILIKASVNTNTDLAGIEWQPSLAKDTRGYYIYSFTAGAYNLIDSVFGINNTLYEYLLSNAALLPESYAVAAFDSCKNTSPISPAFTTMHLENNSDLCTGSNNLTWTAYNNFINGVDSYEIWMRGGTANYSLLATVNASALTYKHVGLVNGIFYEYYVAAKELNSGLKSTSNHVAKLASVLRLPKYTYLRYASVTEDKQIDLAFIGDTSATINSFKILRADNLIGPYKEVGSVPENQANYSQFYSDLNVEPDAQSYFYKIISVDSCGADGPTSNIAKTILLKADENLDLKNLIKWSDYQGWKTGVKDSKLYRYVDGIINPQEIALIPYATNEYIDDITEYSSYSGEFCYSVVAREAAGNLYSFSDSAQSNIVCFKQQSTIYVPNAFTPEGSNPIFKPHFVFVNADGYLFRVYNKWGELMFETSNPEKGWDGKVGDAVVAQGVYVYVMKYKNTVGASFEKRGAVTVVK